jgi:predicted MFS family arabinose efflux permease
VSRTVTKPQLSLFSLVGLSTITFTTTMTELMPAGVLPGMEHGLNVSAAHIGALVTVYAVATAVTSIPLTVAASRLPRRTVLGAVMALMGMVNLVIAASSSYPLTLSVRLLAGACAGMVWSSVPGYASRLSNPANRGRSVTIAMAGGIIALSVGIPLGSLLGEVVGWRQAFAVLGLAGLGLAVWVLIRLPPLSGIPQHKRLPTRRIVTLPGNPIILTTTFALVGGTYLVYTYMAPLVNRADSSLSLALLVFGVSGVVGVWIVGLVIDRYPRRAIQTTTLSTAAAMLVLGVAGEQPAALFVAIGLWGMTFGGVPTLLQTATVNVARDAPDVASSILTTIYNVGIAFGSLAGGVVLSVGGAAALPWAALPIDLAAFALITAGHANAFPHRLYTGGLDAR